MFNKEEMEKARSLSKKMEKALEDVFDNQFYPTLVTALEMVQIELILRSMETTVKEAAKDKTMRRELLELTVKRTVNQVLLDITGTVLALTNYSIILPEEIN